MAFVNKNGERISFECDKLIEELRSDIQEFGGDKLVAVWCRKERGVEVYVNYDFYDAENPILEAELRDEYIKTMTMTALLILLEKQNEIL